jgi:hypothetical protein
VDFCAQFKGLRVLLISVSSAGCLAAGPVSAAPVDCFQWVRASASHLIHPHHPRHVHPGPRAPRRVVAHARAAPRVHRIASPLVRRPIACPEHETVLASPIPGAPPPETLALLERDLAGPPSATEAGQDTAAVAPSDAVEALPPELPGAVFPGGLVGGPGGVDISTPPSSPGGPPPVIVGPPLPPDVEVPVAPPPSTPEVGPSVPPPPEVFPVVSPPPGSRPGPSSGLPEPSAWALMLLGFGAARSALRRRARPATAWPPASRLRSRVHTVVRWLPFA